MSNLYKITLSDGTVFDNCYRVGGDYLTEYEVKDSDFAGKLKHITIEHDEEIIQEDGSMKIEHIVKEYDNLKLSHNVYNRMLYHYNPETKEDEEVGMRYWFAFIKIPDSYFKEMEINSKLEYIAMMTDIDIDE